MSKTLTKTGLVDSLIKTNMKQIYAEGAIDAVVERVCSQFPNEEKSAIRGLVFSRRATLAHKPQVVAPLKLAAPVHVAKRGRKPGKKLALA